MLVNSPLAAPDDEVRATKIGLFSGFKCKISPQIVRDAQNYVQNSLLNSSILYKTIHG
jgi:hypothetical protein